MRVDHLLDLARRKLNRPAAVAMAWECLPKYGASTHVSYTLADDKETWANQETVIFALAEEDEEHARFEAESGKCHLCGGDGQEWRGWSRESGDRSRPCHRCAGTGAAPKEPR